MCLYLVSVKVKLEIVLWHMPKILLAATLAFALGPRRALQPELFPSVGRMCWCFRRRRQFDTNQTLHPCHLLTWGEFFSCPLVLDHVSLLAPAPPHTWCPTVMECGARGKDSSSRHRSCSSRILSCSTQCAGSWPGTGGVGELRECE